LQQAHFVGEIAERGQIVAAPRLVVATRAAGSDVVIPRKPQLMKPVDIATDEQWGVVFEGMEGAVGPSGTAHVAGTGAKYRWAGKTGTAQVVTVKQTESTKHVETDERKREHAWFIAFGPVDDPKIAVSVLVENAGFGATNAAPIARKVLDAYLLGPDAEAAPTKAAPPKKGG
jgi:penicillin-binding protein 2